MSQGRFKVAQQGDYKDSILIQKYVEFPSIQVLHSFFYIKYSEISSLIQLLTDVKKNITIVDIEKEGMIETEEEYLELRELLINEERFEEIKILDNICKHLK